MSYRCSICQQEGHTARTCPKAKTATKSAAAPPATEPDTVVAQLESRLAKLKSEIAVLERIIPELRSVTGA